MILITGGSGHLSSLVVSKAASVGLNIVVGSRKATNGEVGKRGIDFDDPNSLDFSGVETLLLVSAGYAEDDIVIRRHENVIAAAERQGVKHIVYTSLSGTGDHLGFALAHRWTERRLRRSHMAWTILRNGLYAELIGTLAAPINGVIHAPFGTGLISSVSRQDLADAATTVLSDPARHTNTVYELSGDSAWTVADLARKLGVDYFPWSLTQAREYLATLPLLPFQPAMLMSIYSASAAGFLQSDTTDLDLLLKAKPRNTLELATAAAELQN